MTKNIVLCFDGTGDRPGRRPNQFNQTNVWKIYNAAIQNDEQYKWYDPGVGTQGLLDLLFIGGPFGIGLVENLKQGYMELLDHYQPGDRIFLLGFSRGATTARILATIVTEWGLLQKDGWEKYWQEKYDSHPPIWDSGETQKPTKIIKLKAFFIALLCAASSLFFGDIKWRSIEEKPWLNKNKPKDADKRSGKELAIELVFESYKWVRKYKNLYYDELMQFRGKTHSTIVKIECLAVWDTVAALYFNVLSEEFKNKRINRKCAWFHGLKLTTGIKNAFHAVAIDEMRKAFSPELWDKKEIDKIKARNGQVEQVWFAGAHSNVGGGYDDSGLSDIALEWMLHKITNIENGLLIDQNRITLHPNPFATRYHPENGILGLLGKETRIKKMSTKFDSKHRDIHNKIHISVKKRFELRDYYDAYATQLLKLGTDPERVFEKQETEAKIIKDKLKDEDFIGTPI